MGLKLRLLFRHAHPYRRDDCAHLKRDQEKCLASGVDGYVSKPIRTSELFTTIENPLLRPVDLTDELVPDLPPLPRPSR
jgi:hypothetical protein